MDIRFDNSEAEKLVMQMDKYCSGVCKEARELKSIIDEKTEWNDNQMKAFCANMDVIINELNVIVKQEEEYMGIFRQKINELQG